jgi:hypothetical protein
VVFDGATWGAPVLDPDGGAPRREPPERLRDQRRHAEGRHLQVTAALPDGTVLDGTSMEPDIEVGYDPASLARGEDPMLVRAVAELSK